MHLIPRYWRAPLFFKVVRPRSSWSCAGHDAPLDEICDMKHMGGGDAGRSVWLSLSLLVDCMPAALLLNLQPLVAKAHHFQGSNRDTLPQQAGTTLDLAPLMWHEQDTCVAQVSRTPSGIAERRKEQGKRDRHIELSRTIYHT